MGGKGHHDARFAPPRRTDFDEKPRRLHNFTLRGCGAGIARNGTGGDFMHGDRNRDRDRKAAETRISKEDAEPISIDRLGVAMILAFTQDSYCTSGRTTA